MSDTSGYSLLGRVNTPAELRALPRAELPQLAAEMRRCLIETLGRGGGHFAANLGTVELSLALHLCLDTPHDRLVWDVGHQAYPHKILSGRRSALETIRRQGGLAPFNSRAESEYDAFGNGHAGTALSAAAGMAAAVRLKRERRRVVAVIGDGGITAGMAYEAMNHIGTLGLELLVVLNDNDMSISENVGALRDHAARLFASRGIEAPHTRRPAPPANADPGAGALFETLGFNYHGPVDGHDLDALTAALDRLKDAAGPQFLHVVTVKGKGFEPAEADPIQYHGVTRFDPVTGAFAAAASTPTFSQVFGDWLCQAAERDPRLVAITPAMREGSGLVDFARRFPQRYYDVAIAEQHAVTLAAGLACEGLRPVVAIYSTFLQRAYDQLIHDVAIQRLPVLFAVDRAGLVGADGASHQGAFDLSYLRCVPHLLLMAPSDENECRRMLATGLAHDGPSAVRYPRGAGPGAALEAEALPLPIGRGRLLREAQGRRRPRVAIAAFGAVLQAALQAADILDASVADMRFVKPLDEDLLLQLAASHELLVTVEDNVRLGGAGSAVNELLAAHQRNVAMLNLGLPDRFVEHASRAEQLAECGLDSAGILRSVQKRLRARGASEHTQQRQGP
jgi:1-deoxy-D-xylulose-5-phosphate synthase